MTFTYVAGTANDLTRVRLLIGDTDSSVSAQQRLEDEEITDLLTIYGAYRAAAAGAADALAAKFARLSVEKNTGQLSLVWKRYEQLRLLARDLRNGIAATAVPFGGGLSVTTRETNAADTDLVQPAFKRGMLDDPSTVDNTTST